MVRSTENFRGNRKMGADNPTLEQSRMYLDANIQAQQFDAPIHELTSDNLADAKFIVLEEASSSSNNSLSPPNFIPVYKENNFGHAEAVHAVAANSQVDTARPTQIGWKVIPAASKMEAFAAGENATVFVANADSMAYGLATDIMSQLEFGSKDQQIGMVVDHGDIFNIPPQGQNSCLSQDGMMWKNGACGATTNGFELSSGASTSYAFSAVAGGGAQMAGTPAWSNLETPPTTPSSCASSAYEQPMYQIKQQQHDVAFKAERYVEATTTRPEGPALPKRGTVYITEVKAVGVQPANSDNIVSLGPYRAQQQAANAAHASGSGGTRKGGKRRAATAGAPNPNANGALKGVRGANGKVTKPKSQVNKQNVAKMQGASQIAFEKAKNGKKAPNILVRGQQAKAQPMEVDSSQASSSATAEESPSLRDFLSGPHFKHPKVVRITPTNSTEPPQPTEAYGQAAGTAHSKGQSLCHSTMAIPGNPLILMPQHEQQQHQQLAVVGNHAQRSAHGGSSPSIAQPASPGTDVAVVNGINFLEAAQSQVPFNHPVNSMAGSAQNGQNPMNNNAASCSAVPAPVDQAAKDAAAKELAQRRALAIWETSPYNPLNKINEVDASQIAAGDLNPLSYEDERLFRIFHEIERRNAMTKMEKAQEHADFRTAEYMASLGAWVPSEGTINSCSEGLGGGYKCLDDPSFLRQVEGLGVSPKLLDVELFRYLDERRLLEANFLTNASPSNSAECPCCEWEDAEQEAKQVQGQQPQGQQPQDHQAQGHQAQGYQAQGHQPQGHQAQGHQAQGHKALGHQAQGQQVYC